MAGTWSAEGRLKPLWQRLPRADGRAGPGRADDLAARTGIQRNTLSAYNSGGRPLGLAHAELIAAACGAELEELGYAHERSVDERLTALEDQMALLAEAVTTAFVEREQAADAQRAEETLRALAAEIQKGRRPLELPKPGSQRHTGGRTR